MLIPQTRMLIQVQLQKAIGYFNQPKIEEVVQGTVSFKGVLEGSNVNDILVSSLENKVVIINYWATWCPPCVAEMPSFQKLYTTYQENPKVVFLFVTSDSNAKIQRFIKEHQYTFPIYQDNSQVFTEFKHTSIPTTYILNRKGEIKVKKTGAAQWNSQKVHNIISELLIEE